MMYDVWVMWGLQVPQFQMSSRELLRRATRRSSHGRLSTVSGFVCKRDRCRADLKMIY